MRLADLTGGARRRMPSGMNARQQSDPVRTARRVGMSIVVALIVWTIAAVTVGVLRGLSEYRDAPEAPGEP